MLRAILVLSVALSASAIVVRQAASPVTVGQEFLKNSNFLLQQNAKFYLYYGTEPGGKSAWNSQTGWCGCDFNGLGCTGGDCSTANKGNGKGYGLFSQALFTGFTFTDGVVLSTGDVTHVPSQAGQLQPEQDIDFEPFKVAGAQPGSPTDGTHGDTVGFAITFPTPQASLAQFTVEFQYIFASKELPVHAGQEFNDEFSILVNGQTSAFLQTSEVESGGVFGAGAFGGDAVSQVCQQQGNTQFFGNFNRCLVTVNNLCSSTNVASCDSRFFFDNSNLGEISYKGHTRPMKAIVPLLATQNAVNNVTIILSDKGDGKYDSAVFLRTGSFTTVTATSAPTPAPTGATYRAQMGPWSACDATCGTGQQTRQLFCFDSVTNLQVGNNLCGGNAVPTTQVCTLSACPSYSWAYNPLKGPCSASCGNATRTVGVICVQDQTRQQVSDTLCPGREKLQDKTEQCSLSRCVQYSYRTGDWTTCGVTCGNGLQTREVVCQTDKNEQVDDSFCAITLSREPKPIAFQQCRQNPCPSYRYKTTEWEKCSTSCGVGTQRRSWSCVNNLDESTVDAALCATIGSGIPVQLKTCDPPNLPCQSFGYTYSQWGRCSVSCGSGTKTRQVSCVNGAGGSMPEAACSGQGLIKPKDSVACTLATCPTYSFEALEWSSCSLSCTTGTGGRGGGRGSDGTKTRIVHCTNQFGHIVPESNCGRGATVRPPSYKLCEEQLPACEAYTAVWTDWSPCSATCGTATRSREKICKDAAGKRTPLDACPAGSFGRENTETEGCPFRPCPTYRFTNGPWGVCSASCGMGVRTRDVTCTDDFGKKVDDDNCSGQKEPAESCLAPIAVCTTKTWTVDEWCTGHTDPCYGDDVKYTRNVNCRDSTNRLVRDEECMGIAPAKELTCTHARANDKNDAERFACECERCAGSGPVPTPKPAAVSGGSGGSGNRLGLEKKYSELTNSDKRKVAQDLATELGLTGCAPAVVFGDQVTVECANDKTLTGVFKDPTARRRQGSVFEYGVSGSDQTEPPSVAQQQLGAVLEFSVSGVDTAVIQQATAVVIPATRPAPAAVPSSVGTPAIGRPPLPDTESPAVGTTPAPVDATPAPVDTTPAPVDATPAPVDAIAVPTPEPPVPAPPQTPVSEPPVPTPTATPVTPAETTPPAGDPSPAKATALPTAPAPLTQTTPVSPPVSTAARSTGALFGFLLTAILGLLYC